MPSMVRISNLYEFHAVASQQCLQPMSAMAFATMQVLNLLVLLIIRMNIS